MIGSSPLTRGTQDHIQSPLSAERFIPAYAGNSAEKAGNMVSDAVHPRLRGELIKGSSNITNVAGSSPLTRGTLPYLFN